MSEIKFIQFNLDHHREAFLQLNIETMDWHFNEFKEHYDLDAEKLVGSTSIEIAKSSLETYRELKPPLGIFYIIYIEDKAAGMGAIRKHGDDFGEIKRMYNRPQFRGRGLGKIMVSRLLEEGRKLGFTWFGLNTPKFAYAAQHVYKSAGFREFEVFPEVDIGDLLRPYYMFMEKRE